MKKSILIFAVFFWTPFSLAQIHLFEGKSALDLHSFSNPGEAEALARFDSRWAALKKAALWISENRLLFGQCQRFSSLELAFSLANTDTTFAHAPLQKASAEWITLVSMEESSAHRDAPKWQSGPMACVLSFLCRQYDSSWQALRALPQGGNTDLLSDHLLRLLRLEQAPRFLRKGRFNEAISEFQKYLKKDPMNPVVRVGCGEAFFKKKDLKQALICLDVQTPDSTLLAFSKLASAQCFAALDSLHPALQEIREALLLQPQWPECHFTLGLILEKMDDCANARHAYHKSLALSCSENISDEAKARMKACGKRQKP